MRASMMMFGMGAALLATASTDARSTPLGAAARSNAADDIRALLGQGWSPDHVDDAGMTPLVSAARAGALDSLRVLLDAGANVDARDRRSTQWTPLQHAVHRQQAGAVRLLLERGANANLGTAVGWTPLMMAAGDPDPAIVIALLDAGANPRAMTTTGDTALTQAVSGGALSDIDRPLLGGCFFKTVRALLARDPDLRLPDNFAGRSARFWARLRQCEDVLSLVR